MASNLHFIFSDVFKGCGLISGGPFSYFTERSKFKDASGVKVENLIEQTKSMEEKGQIQSLENIKRSPIFIFFGEKDYVLADGVTQKAN